MAQGNTVRVAVLPGDGIGPEVTAAALAVLEPLAKRHGIGLSTETLPAGAFHYRETGEALPGETFRRAESADAVVMAAAPELPRGIRINAVSPNVLANSPHFHDAFAGMIPVTDEEVAAAFVRAVEGNVTGRTLTV